VLSWHIYVAANNIIYSGLQAKCATFLYHFNTIWNFPTDFHQGTPFSNVTEIHPVGAALIHADRRTESWAEMTELINAFCNYTNAFKSTAIFKFNSSEMTGLPSFTNLLQEQTNPVQCTEVLGDILCHITGRITISYACHDRKEFFSMQPNGQHT
jgi:hypothetical protein